MPDGSLERRSGWTALKFLNVWKRRTDWMELFHNAPWSKKSHSLISADLFQFSSPSSPSPPSALIADEMLSCADLSFRRTVVWPFEDDSPAEIPSALSGPACDCADKPRTLAPKTNARFKWPGVCLYANGRNWCRKRDMQCTAKRLTTFTDFSQSLSRSLSPSSRRSARGISLAVP